MYKLIILFLVFYVIYGCYENGYNKCQSNDQCCSKLCKGIPAWEFGICITCNELGYNMCKTNHECCSKFCWGIPEWEFGICKEANVTKEEVPEIVPVNFEVTWDEFNDAVISNGYPAPTKEQYDTVVKMAAPAGSINSKEELAMFLAQVLWESGGLQFKKEIRCAETNCPNEYRTGREAPDKYYFGRGYIQLTWIYNYEQCTKALHEDNRLVENPELVSDTEDGAWGSAFWYWKTKVHNQPGVDQGQFGATTNAINGALECRGLNTQKAKRRFELYVNVLKAFNLGNVKPIESGCY